MTDQTIAPVEAKALDSANVRHGFFTRHGGVSSGVYASLNCGPGSDDDPTAVEENRRRAAAYLAGKTAAPLTAYQIHTDQVIVVDGPFPAGDRPHADGLVTRTPGVVIGALAADCAPVLLADAKAGVIGAAHAGWRGAVAGIVDQTVRAMEGLGADRRNIAAVVGPCIGQASYEVGLEFEAAFLRDNPAAAAFFKPGVRADKRQFDLARYLVDRMGRLELGSVGSVGIDVYAEPERFFSYRMSRHVGAPDYARLLSAIVLV